MPSRREAREQAEDADQPCRGHRIGDEPESGREIVLPAELGAEQIGDETEHEKRDDRHHEGGDRRAQRKGQAGPKVVISGVDAEDLLADQAGERADQRSAATRSEISTLSGSWSRPQPWAILPSASYDGLGPCDQARGIESIDRQLVAHCISLLQLRGGQGNISPVTRKAESQAVGARRAESCGFDRVTLRWSAVAGLPWGEETAMIGMLRFLAARPGRRGSSRSAASGPACDTAELCRARFLGRRLGRLSQRPRQPRRAQPDREALRRLRHPRELDAATRRTAAAAFRGSIRRPDAGTRPGSALRPAWSSSMVDPVDGKMVLVRAVGRARVPMARTADPDDLLAGRGRRGAPVRRVFRRPRPDLAAELRLHLPAASIRQD